MKNKTLKDAIDELAIEFELFKIKLRKALPEFIKRILKLWQTNTWNEMGKLVQNAVNISGLQLAKNACAKVVKVASECGIVNNPELRHSSFAVAKKQFEEAGVEIIFKNLLTT